MTNPSPFSDELVRAVAKALADHLNDDRDLEFRLHWSSFTEQAKVALLARKQFKRDRKAELDRLVRDVKEEA